MIERRLWNSRRLRNRLGPWTALAVVFGLVGCGGSTETGTEVVAGSVQFVGYPLAGGTIVFAPDPDRGSGQAVSTMIEPDGSFRFGVYNSPGLKPGWYRIAMAEPPGVFEQQYGLPDFPKELRRPDKSGILREVKAGQANVFCFEIDVPR